MKDTPNYQYERYVQWFNSLSYNNSLYVKLWTKFLALSNHQIYWYFVFVCFFFFTRASYRRWDSPRPCCSVMFRAHRPRSIRWNFWTINLVSSKISWILNINEIFWSYLSSDGSLLNISVGTVGGAFSGTSSRYVCRDSKCRSTSSGVMWPSDINDIDTMLFAVCTWDGIFFLN